MGRSCLRVRRPSSLRQFRHGDADRALGFRDHPERLGVEFNGDQAHVG